MATQVGKRRHPWPLGSIEASVAVSMRLLIAVLSAPDANDVWLPNVRTLKGPGTAWRRVNTTDFCTPGPAYRALPPKGHPGSQMSLASAGMRTGTARQPTCNTCTTAVGSTAHAPIVVA